MKRFSYAGLLLSLCLSAAACGDDSNSSGASDGGDAGSPPGEDAGKDAAAGADAAADGGMKLDAGGEDGGGGSDDGGAVADATVDAGGSGGDPFSGVMLTVIYAAETTGVDTRPKAAATVGTDGTLQKYTARLFDGTLSPNEHPTQGTCKADALFIDSTVALGRLYGGTMGGKFYASTLTFGAKEGFHYAVGLFDTSLPSSGSVAYTQLASTKPTILGGASNPGTVTGSAKVDFTTMKVGVSLTVKVGGDTYTLETTGGTADPSTSEVTLDTTRGTFGGVLTLPNAGAACTGATCTGFIQGSVFGEGEERLGIVFGVTGTGGGGDGIHGAMVLEK